MGVNGLWTVLQPCARPIKLETLNKKRLAVDASIWIYQFLKAVRDKEGHALRNAHVVGFFRRICKLLFVGIRPVFVFDGGAPILKRQTISSRKARREGRREDAVRTAGKLLAVQMKRRAEEDERRRREEATRASRPVSAEEALPDESELVYVDEIGLDTRQRQQNRRFRKTDAYHLPDVQAGFAGMGQPNDPRVMSQEELEEYARQFHTGEDVNLYDFSKIDFDGAFFASLPATDRYNILNAARLRSRLRMGYSKEQLDTMFPDRMAFSRFQVDRVRERNELTQRLMNLNGMNPQELLSLNGRVAGERGKEYVLVKNDGVEGGWALGVVSNKNEGQRNKPIDVDELGAKKPLEDDLEDDEGLEDVPIEGLNRLPKRPRIAIDGALDSSTDREKRQDLYQQRRQAAGPGRSVTVPEADAEQLFVSDVSPVQGTAMNEDRFEDYPLTTQLDDGDEEEQLRIAIAMSLEQDEGMPLVTDNLRSGAVSPLPGSQHAVSSNNKPAEDQLAASSDDRIQPHGPFMNESDDEDDFEDVMAEHSADLRKAAKEELVALQVQDDKAHDDSAGAGVGQRGQWDGPLPFEPLNLGKSILGKRKAEKLEAARDGGFEKSVPHKSGEDEARPAPPWFSGDVRDAKLQQDLAEKQQKERDQREGSEILIPPTPVLKTHPTREVIDVDEPHDDPETIIVPSEDEENSPIEEVRPIDHEVRMGDLADLARAEPSESTIPQSKGPVKAQEPEATEAAPLAEPEGIGHEEEEIEWSESDRETRPGADAQSRDETDKPDTASAESSDADFEDVQISARTSAPPAVAASSPSPQPPKLPQDDTIEEMEREEEELDAFSDPEDEELFKQLADEAEEHARFAASLNSGSGLQSAEDYERELRQLRNQQKKDRRDADEVTQIMVAECQQLLRLFGLPYLTAPMEAEAQCAELVTLGLVDGIVTDDSDVFLFGGTRVYKNMFNQAKFVECYLSADLERELALTRSRAVQLAHLLGSDYAEGLPGVGPVTALEILSEFGDLDTFATWWTGVQRHLGAATRDADPRETKGFRKKFRKHATKLFLPPAFPDRRVDEAYLRPEVDHDASAFAWGVPDLAALRAFLMATVGWGQERADEILVPVIRDMNRRETEGTQANITRFFAGNVGSGTARPKAGQAGAIGAGGGDADQSFAPRRRAAGKSKRLENALGKLAQNNGESERLNESEEQLEGSRGEDNNRDVGQTTTANSKNGRKTQRKSRAAARRGSSDDDDNNAEEDEAYRPSQTRATARRGRPRKQPV